ncbi:MAG: SUKH-4 family immunity protein [Terricaulis sp.]
MDIQSYSQHWTVKRLTCFAPDVLSDLRIPDFDKTFLRDVGMPTPGRKIGANDLSWDVALTPVEKERRRIGWNYGSPYLIGEPDGTVMEASRPQLPGAGLYNILPERRINSSVRQFAAFLTEEDMWRTRCPPYARDDVDNVSLLEERWVRIDPEAMADPMTYWQIFIDEERMPTQ